jgi:LPS sulfotransferase NodH
MNISTLTLKIRNFEIRLNDWLYTKKILGGSHDYTKFIILSRPRSGSNFLCSLLQSHPDIRAFEELFPKNRQSIHWGYQNYPSSARILSLRELESHNFIKEIIFREFHKSVSAVGFKIFYHQSRHGSAPNVWPYLIDDKSLNVIHLKRKNLLRVCLSHALARKTNKWTLKNHQKIKDSDPINLRYEDCLDVFNESQRWEDIVKKDFCGHKLVDLYYEDLVVNTGLEARRVQDFLGVKQKNLYASTLRQNTSKLQDSIVNYFQLKQQFENTPWHIFFED